MGLPGPLFLLQMHKIPHFTDLPLRALSQSSVKLTNKFPSTISPHSPHVRSELFFFLLVNLGLSFTLWLSAAVLEEPALLPAQPLL